LRNIRSLDVDLPGLLSLGFGNDNTEDAVLEACLHSVLIDTSGEAEGAVEFADGSLADPVLGLTVLLLRDVLLRLLGDLVVISVVVLDSGLLRMIIFDFALLGGLSFFDETLRATTFFLDCLVTARDGQGVRIRPLDVDVLLVDAWEFTGELIDICLLLDVELGREGADLLVEVLEDLTVVVVKETEEGRELLSESREERHCSWCAMVVSSDWNRRLGDAVELLWKSADSCAC
jgi:hypothetical protein